MQTRVTPNAHVQSNHNYHYYFRYCLISNRYRKSIEKLIYVRTRDSDGRYAHHYPVYVPSSALQ